MDKQEAIAAVKACMAADDENQCTGCPGDEGLVCKYIDYSDPKVYIPYKLIQGILDILENDDGGYKSGVNDVWDAMRKISLNFDGAPSVDDLRGLFGTAVAVNIIRDFEPQTVIERIKNFSLNKLKDVSIGDEVERVDDGQKFVVVRWSSDGSVYLIDHDGVVQWYLPTGFKKTGRHYGSLPRMLKMIGGGNDDASELHDIIQKAVDKGYGGATVKEEKL